MNRLKVVIKKFFRLTHTYFILDKFIFIKEYIINCKGNRDFKRLNQGISLPPPYFLYETYRLNYSEYIHDGKQSAKEIIERVTALKKDIRIILEWGCGVSRLVRHMPELLNNNSEIYACDINKKMINWNKSNIENVRFDFIDYLPPTSYSNNKFDFIYAISVLTHIQAEIQVKWFSEINRILKADGIFMFTTHGSFFRDKLTKSDLNELMVNGSFTYSYFKRGHRMMTTFNTEEGVRKLLGNNFAVIKIFDGETDARITGGQDLWIVKKITESN